MNKKIVLFILTAAVLVGASAYIVHSKATAKHLRENAGSKSGEQGQREFSSESHEVRRKAAEMLLPDTQGELRFDGPQSTSKPVSTKEPTLQK